MIDLKAYNGLTKDDMEREITAMYNEGPHGLQKMAELALQPLKEGLLHESRTRGLFAKYDLGVGEESVFDTDVRVGAWQLSVNGLPYQSQPDSRGRYRIDTSPMSSKALVKWNESNYRKFDILNYTQERAKSSLLEQEDARAIALIEAASTGSNAAINSTGGRLTIESIAKARAIINNALKTPGVKLVIPASMESDLIIMQSSSNYPVYAPTTQEELIKKGTIGTIAGLEVITIPLKQDGSTIIDQKTAYILGPSELVGVLAVRSEVTPKAQMDVRNEGDIICFWQDLGYLIYQSRGIVKINITA